MKSSILNAIPIDIVEIIIVKSKNYNLFLRLQDLLDKLKEQTRISRINYKLTETLISGSIIFYILNGKLHNEYNKPSEIHINSGEYRYYTYDVLHSNHGYPSTVTCEERFWRIYGNIYRDNDLPRRITNNGAHDWNINKYHSEKSRKNNLPYFCNASGERCHGIYNKYMSIFEYI